MSSRWSWLALAIAIAFVGSEAASDPQDALTRIDDPQRWFAGHDRAGWIGRRVCILPAGKSSDETARVFSRQLRSGSSHPKAGQITGRTARILEVWYGGSRRRRFNDRELVTPDLYWKLRFEDTDEVLWFKDDGSGPPHSLGFWDEMLAARRWLGDTVWVKSERFLSTEGDQAAIELENLELLRIVAVEWGEFGNYPLKFVLETEAGLQGYLAVRDTTDFHDRWHWADPRPAHPEWTEKIWQAIAQRRLLGGMTAEMVRLSWGDPDSTAAAAGSLLWFYEGVNKRQYRIKLVDGRLVAVLY